MYDPETDGFISVEPSDQVWPVVEAMPMVWSWALHICTGALEHVVRITGTGRDQVREKCEAPLMTVAEPVCSVYVDNINVHDISTESCDRRHQVITAALEALVSVSMRSPEPPNSINNWACASTGSPVFYVMILAAFRGPSCRLRVLCYQHSIGCIDSKLIHLTAGGDTLELTWQNFVLWPEWSGSLKCELGRPFSHVVFCSDAALRRYCVQCTTASFKEATRFRKRWRFRAREISHTLPVRHADGIACRGALSPLGGHSCDDPKEQDVSDQEANFGRAANFEEVSTRYGAWLDARACVPEELLCGLPVLKAMEIEECGGQSPSSSCMVRPFSLAHDRRRQLQG